VAGALAFHVSARQAVQLFINDGRQFFQRVLVATAPGAQQSADVLRIRFSSL